MNSLHKKYKKEMVKQLKKELELENEFSVPGLEKIVLNVGLGEAVTDSQALERMLEDIGLIAGQKPVITKSKSAISNFKIREGDEIGLKVTLRRERMWNFLQKLIDVVLPRVKDFRGISGKSFDGRGNYALGITEHTVFPEVDPNKIDKLRSFQIIIVTTALTDEAGKKLLTMLGMPFVKEDKANVLKDIEEQEAKEKEDLSKLKNQRASEGAAPEESN